MVEKGGFYTILKRALAPSNFDKRQPPAVDGKMACLVLMVEESGCNSECDRM